MLTLRNAPFELFEKLEQQLSHAERVPAAEVRETDSAYTISLELPGVERTSIDVKATERSLVISAERKAPEAPTAATGDACTHCGSTWCGNSSSGGCASSQLRASDAT